MTKISIYIILLCVFLLSKHGAFGQTKIFNNWYFGDKAGINFNTNPPSALINGKLNTLEGTASISDTLGNLLFYTDGIKVWNKNHQQMANGFSLLGDISSTNSALIVPQPRNDSLYYIFTTDAQELAFGGCGCLSYSIVNIKLNNGLGDIITSSKNIIIRNSVTEKLIGVSPTDSLVWIIAHDWNSTNFIAYKLTPNGLNNSPIISSSGHPHCCDLLNENTAGQMKVSPNGKKLAVTIRQDSLVELFDFNADSGKINNPQLIYHIERPYGLEFSPNSQLLYLTDGHLHKSYLRQFDISSNNAAIIRNSVILIDSLDTWMYGQLQLAPDNKIYTTRIYEYDISAINNPNNLGHNCNFVKQQLYLENIQNGALCKLGLPNQVLYCKITKDDENNLPQKLCDSLILPNVITPNGDGINDYLTIKCAAGTQLLPEQITLYNRWGNKLQEAVDGEMKNLDTLSDGVYYYCIKYGDRNYYGFFSIIK